MKISSYMNNMNPIIEKNDAKVQKENKQANEKHTMEQSVKFSISTSVICAGIFSVFYGICLRRMGASEKQTIHFALSFLGGITIVAFIVLRILSYLNQNRRRNAVKERTSLKTTASCTKIYNAKDIVEAGKIIELFKEHGITAFSQEASANVAMHGMSGFGIYGVDVFVETDEAEKAMQILEDMDASISKEKF